MRMQDLSFIKTPAERCQEVAARAKSRRKAMGLTQAELASKSGVSLGSLRRFEQTGEISFHSLARIAQALECAEDLEDLFTRRYYRDISEVIEEQRNRSRDSVKMGAK